jgi:hypothetical protein
MLVNRSVALVVLVAAGFALPACSDEYSDDDCFKGSAAIEKESDVTALEPYNCIAGTLVVYDATLTSLELPHLETIRGDLLLTPLNGGDHYLTNLDLSSLVSVEGDVSIVDHYSLENLDGLSGLTSVGGKLEIGWNDALTGLAGLSSLSSVGGNLTISGNQSLTSLGMNALTEVGGGISITQNSSLPQCEACELVEQVGGDPQGINANLQDSCANYICY